MSSNIQHGTANVQSIRQASGNQLDKLPCVGVNFPNGLAGRLALVWITGLSHAEIKLQFNFVGGDRGLAGAAGAYAVPCNIR